MLGRRLQLDLPNARKVDSMTWRAPIRAGAEQDSIEDAEAWFRRCAPSRAEQWRVVPEQA